MQEPNAVNIAVVFSIFISALTHTQRQAEAKITNSDASLIIFLEAGLCRPRKFSAAIHVMTQSQWVLTQLHVFWHLSILFYI